jgi:hypothetical protein
MMEEHTAKTINSQALTGKCAKRNKMTFRKSSDKKYLKEVYLND